MLMLRVKSMDFSLHPSTRWGRETDTKVVEMRIFCISDGDKIFLEDARFLRLRRINLENIHEEKENEQMTSTIYKRRSINLDDRTYKRGKAIFNSYRDAKRTAVVVEDS
jgi:hypothetical protein